VGRRICGRLELAASLPISGHNAVCKADCRGIDGTVATFRVTDDPGAAGVRGTKEHCDTLFRDATRVRQMTRADLTGQVYQAIEIPWKESDVVVCAIFDGIVRALRSGDKVEIRGFGSFHTRQRRARIGRNPKTGARVEVPPKRIPFFKPSKELRELVDRLNVNV
jgi:integration host factor subunit beta